jgi:hypothetical protein
MYLQWNIISLQLELLPSVAKWLSTESKTHFRQWTEHSQYFCHNVCTKPNTTNTTHLLPTAVAWDRSCGICGGQRSMGAGFFWVLQFALSVIPPIAPHSSSSIIIWGRYNRPVVVVSIIVDFVPINSPPPPKKRCVTWLNFHIKYLWGWRLLFSGHDTM